MVGKPWCGWRGILNIWESSRGPHPEVSSSSSSSTWLSMLLWYRLKGRPPERSFFTGPICEWDRVIVTLLCLPNLPGLVLTGYMITGEVMLGLRLDITRQFSFKLFINNTFFCTVLCITCVLCFMLKYNRSFQTWKLKKKTKTKRVRHFKMLIVNT